MNETPAPTQKLSKIKLYFLYTFIGGLGISALISVAALLIGSFNETLLRALMTTILFVLHSALVLLLILADRNNQLGRKVIPTAVLGFVFASVLIAPLGLWEVISGDVTGRLYNILWLLLGTSFIVAGVQAMLIRHQVTKVLTYTTQALVSLFVFLLAGYLAFVDSSFVELTGYYYRLIAASAILATTAAVILVVIRSIAVHQKPELKPAPQAGYPGGMLAVVITVGTLAAIAWLGILGSVIASGAEQGYKEDRPTVQERGSTKSSPRYYED